MDAYKTPSPSLSLAIVSGMPDEPYQIASHGALVIRPETRVDNPRMIRPGGEEWALLVILPSIRWITSLRQ
jgi:hypothetical protein